MPERRLSTKLLDGWIKELFPPEAFPLVSEEAKQYVQSVIKDKVLPIANIADTQHLVAQLAGPVYDYIAQRQELSKLTKDLTELVKEKREQVMKIHEEIANLHNPEFEGREIGSKSSEEEWNKHINKLMKLEKGDYKALIKQSILKSERKSFQIKTMVSLISKADPDEKLGDIISRLEKIPVMRTESFITPDRVGINPELEKLSPPVKKRRRSTSAQSLDATPHIGKFDRISRTFSSSDTDLTGSDKIRRLQNCNIDYFYGIRNKSPYGEDFNMYLKLFERFAQDVADETKLDELIKRLRGEAFNFLTNANNADLNFTYETLVKSLKAVFFKVETSNEKRIKYETLKQKDDEHLEIFQIRFENLFKEYYSLISGPESSLMTDEIFKCNQFYMRIRDTLRKQLNNRKKILMDNKEDLTWNKLIAELRNIEKEFPAGETVTKPINNIINHYHFGSVQKSESNFNQNRYNSNKYQKSQNKGNINQQLMAPPTQGKRPVNCFNCRQDGHYARDCKMAPKFDPYQPQGNSIDIPPRGINRVRGGTRSNRGTRGLTQQNIRGNPHVGVTNFNGRLNIAQNAEDQQDNDYSNQPDNNRKLSVGTSYSEMLAHMGEKHDQKTSENSSYAEHLAQKFMKSQFDPQSEPIIHVVSHRMMKCIDPSTKGESDLPTFSLAAARCKPAENPPWISKRMKEETVDRVKDIRNWIKSIADVQKTQKFTPVELKRLKSVQESKWTCVDDTRLVCPLLIEGVCIEDILLDTGSQFNAISLKALWALMGRFPAWEKAFETAISWCNNEKVIQAAGGQEIPILAVIRLHVQVAGKKAMPINWAVYQDTEPIIVLGTKGMRALELELKSPNLGNVNILVPKNELVSTSNKVFRAAFQPIKIDKNSEIPTEVDTESGQSEEIPELVDSETEEARKFVLAANIATDPPLLEGGNARFGMIRDQSDLDILNALTFDPDMGRLTMSTMDMNTNYGRLLVMEDIENQNNDLEYDRNSYQLENSPEEDSLNSRQQWDQWDSPVYDE